MSHTKNTGDKFITTLYVAYNATTETHDDGTTYTVPVYITIPREDWPGSIDERDELFELLRLEGAIAAKLVEGSPSSGDADGNPSIDERLFTPDESLEPVFVVTDPLFDAVPPYTATLAELRVMYPDTDFVESNSGPVIVEPGKGPRYIGILARQWRDRRAGKISLEEVPIVREGEYPPNDRTYVFVSAPSDHYRNSPDLQPNVRRMEYSPDVVPYANGRALWSYVEGDWFALLGTERAIEAARQAVALVVGARAYDGYHHYRQFVSGRPYHPRQRGFRPRGEVMVTGDDAEPVTMPGTRTRGFTGFVGIPSDGSASSGDRRTIAVCASRDSDVVAWMIDVADLSKPLQSLADNGELWGIYQTPSGGVVAEDRDGMIYTLEPPNDDRTGTIEPVAARVYDQLAAEAEHGESGFGEAAKQVARVARNTADRLRLTAVLRDAVTRPSHYGTGPVIVRFEDGSYDAIPSTTYDDPVWRSAGPPCTIVIDWRGETRLIDGTPRLLDKSGTDLRSYSDDDLYDYVTG